MQVWPWVTIIVGALVLLVGIFNEMAGDMLSSTGAWFTELLGAVILFGGIIWHRLNAIVGVLDPKPHLGIREEVSKLVASLPTHDTIAACADCRHRVLKLSGAWCDSLGDDLPSGPREKNPCGGARFEPKLSGQPSKGAGGRSSSAQTRPGTSEV